MTAELLITIIIAIIAASPGIIALWTQRRKQAAEVRSIESEITLRYQNMLTDAQERLSALEKGRAADREEFDLKIKVLQAEVKTQTHRADRFERWAKRLAQQLHDANIIPVSMD